MTTAAGRKRTEAARKAAAVARKRKDRERRDKPAQSSGGGRSSDDDEPPARRRDRQDRNARIAIGSVAVLGCIGLAVIMSIFSWGGLTNEEPDEPNDDQEPGEDPAPDEEPADDDQGGGDEPDQGEGDDDQDGDQDGEGQGDQDGDGDGGEGGQDGDGDDQDGEGDGQNDGEGDGEEDQPDPPDCWPGVVVPQNIRDDVLAEVVALMPDKPAPWMDDAGYSYQSVAEYYMVAGIRRAMMKMGAWQPAQGDVWPGVGNCVSENGQPCCYVQQPSQLELADAIALAFEG